MEPLFDCLWCERVFLTYEGLCVHVRNMGEYPHAVTEDDDLDSDDVDNENSYCGEGGCSLCDDLDDEDCCGEDCEICNGGEED